MRDWVSCECGKSRGRYIDGLNAVIDGDDAIALGFANRTLVESLAREEKDNREGTVRRLGHTFSAFVIPWAAPTVGRPQTCPCGDDRVLATPDIRRKACACGKQMLEMGASTFDARFVELQQKIPEQNGSDRRTTAAVRTSSARRKRRA